MKWVSAISAKATVEGCVEEAVASVRKQLDGLEAHLIVVFVSPHFQEKYALIPLLIRERIVSGVLIGCSGGGIIGGGREVEQSPALSVTVAHMPGVTIESFHSEYQKLY